MKILLSNKQAEEFSIWFMYKKEKMHEIIPYSKCHLERKKDNFVLTISDNSIWFLKKYCDKNFILDHIKDIDVNNPDYEAAMKLTDMYKDDSEGDGLLRLLYFIHEEIIEDDYTDMEHVILNVKYILKNKKEI
jgi:hypothetical protein